MSSQVISTTTYSYPTGLPTPEEAAAFLANFNLIDSDGEPLETTWHHAQISLLIDILTTRWKDREDFYCAGNMFIYFNIEQARNRDYRGPDFFFVNNVNRRPDRRYWVVWKEAYRFPNVIVELLSESTEVEDRTTKKAIYEQVFRTPEYFLYDFETRKIEGWRLGSDHRYESIEPNEDGTLWSEEFQAWLGLWTGPYLNLVERTWVRLFTAEGVLIPNAAEAQLLIAVGERLRADFEAQRANDEAQRANDEAQRANDEAQRANVERQLRGAAAAENVRLKAELEALRAAQKNGN